MNKFWNKINKPYFWGYIYILNIVVFTFIYLSIGDQFAFSNSTKERQYNDLHIKVVEDFEKNLINLLTSRESGKLIMCDDEERYGLDLKSISVDYFDVDDISFYISVDVLDFNSVKHTEDQSIFETNTQNYKIQLSGQKFKDNQENIIQEAKLFPIGYGYLPFIKEDLSKEIDISRCFGGEDWSINLTYPMSISNDIYQLMKGVSGFNYDVGDSFFRMLYLSLVTITTLGFGDISPVTDIARMLVGIEAIFGVVIMGLFLNSVGAIKSKSKKEYIVEIEELI